MSIKILPKQKLKQSQNKWAIAAIHMLSSQPEFYPHDLWDERRERTPTTCLLTCTCMLWQEHTQMLIEQGMHIKRELYFEIYKQPQSLLSIAYIHNMRHLSHILNLGKCII